MLQNKIIYGAAALLGAVSLTTTAGAADDSGHAHHHHDAGGAMDEPAHHHGDGDEAHNHTPPERSDAYEVSVARYDIPKLTLVDQYGNRVRIDKLLAEDRPTLVQFIFTSCTTICPVMGAVFGAAQPEIHAIAPNYRMVSVSIDPEYDTPESLRDFAMKNDAGPDWVFLTGSVDDVMRLVKSFDALYQGDNKMYHQPYTFIRWNADEDWVRIRGLMNVADLVSEFSAAGGVSAADASSGSE